MGMHFEQRIYKWLNKLCGLYSNNAAINCADCHLGWMTFVEFLEWFPMMDLYQTLVVRPHCVQPSQCRSWGKNPWVATTITATKLMFAAEMLRHFAAEIWNSLCNLICSSSYKTWKCCNKLKFTIPRFRRRFCFFLVSSCKDCWRFLSLLLELFFLLLPFSDISTIRVQFPIFTFCESARQSTDLKTWSQFPF